MNQEAANSSAGPNWWQRFMHGLPMLLLLGLGSLLVPWDRWLEEFDGWFMRNAVENVVLNQHQPGHMLDPWSPLKRVVVLEASTLMRVRELEHDGQGLDQATLDRVGGVRPIVREKLAKVLEDLSQQLDLLAQRAAATGGSTAVATQLPHSLLPKVVAIDVDIAPLQPGPPDARLIAALQQLRKHVHVVAIALDRSTQPERAARNTFMVDDAQCTRKCSRSVFDKGAPNKGLFFASSRVFHTADGYPLHFPVERLTRKDTSGRGDSAAEPRDFPSLGNLLHALATESAVSDRSLATLTSLCDDAARVGDSAPGLIEEDSVAGRDCVPGYETDCPVRIQDTHRLHRINWKLAGFGPIDSIVLAPDGPGRAAPGTVRWQEIDFGALHAGALVLGIDGGARHDRFEGASVMLGAISGARLHALLAASRHEPAWENESLSFLVDVLVGLLFLAIWVSVLPVIELIRRRSARGALAALSKASLLSALSVGIGWMYVELWSPRLLQHFDLWANPAYLLAGLALGAYVDMSSQQHDDVQPGAWPDFSFGFARMQYAAPTWDEFIVSTLAMLVCGAGIIELGLQESGRPAAIACAALIGISFWTHRRNAR